VEAQVPLTLNSEAIAALLEEMPMGVSVRSSGGLGNKAEWGKTKLRLLTRASESHPIWVLGRL